jgi:murein DD-endopeptidase MepM/ murein hydrolase activator NlpD
LPRRNAVASAVFLGISFTLIACISIRRAPALETAAPSYGTADTLEPVSEERFDIWEDNPEDFYALPGGPFRAGEPVTLIFLPAAGADSARHAGMRAVLSSKDGKRLAEAVFFDWRLDDEGHTVKASVFAVPSTFDGGEAVITAGGVSFEIRLEGRAFASEEIRLNPGNTALRTVPDPRKTAEAERLWAILSRSGGTVYTEGPFTPPVAADTRRTSFFGDRRVYRYSSGSSDTAVHAGIDYGVPVGTPVAACADGRVVLAGERIVTGNSVIIEHLPGVYSIYYHLDKAFAEEGADVKQGDVIGLSGVTGLATGPHLHWELRAATENMDPDAVCAGPILDAEAALKLINERGERYAQLSR